MAWVRSQLGCASPHQALGAVGMVSDRLDLPLELAVVDGRGQHPLPGVAHPGYVDRRPVPELGADRVLPEVVRLLVQPPGDPVGRRIGRGHDHGHPEPARHLLPALVQPGIAAGEEAGPVGEAGHLAAGVQVDADVDVRPDLLPHEAGDAVGDSRHGRVGARPLDEDPVEVEAVVPRALPVADAEGGGVEDRHQQDAAEDIPGADLAQQVLDRHRALVLVAVAGAEGDQAFPRTRLRADDDGQGNQVASPDAGMGQADPVVAPTRALEVDFTGRDDSSFHFFFSRKSGFAL